MSDLTLDQTLRTVGGQGKLGLPNLRSNGSSFKCRILRNHQVSDFVEAPSVGFGSLPIFIFGKPTYWELKSSADRNSSCA